MTDLLSLSTRILDQGERSFPVRVNQELSEIADGVAVIESFSNVIAFSTDAGLLLSDTSGALTGAAVVKSLRAWSDAPLHTVLYTHGHIDHVGGAGAFIADTAERGHPKPRFVGHENLPGRFSRYNLTAGYNARINARQFGDAAKMSIGGLDRFLPKRTPLPDVTFRDRLGLRVGELRLELRHARGETDDHAWAWVPEAKLILTGDLFIWNFPNAGNPQKVQRFPLEWANALREMAGLGAELLVPAHGIPIGGAERIRRVLDDTAGALESLVSATLERMNAGEPLDKILHAVKLPDELLSKPYLRPLYDEPEFVIRNLWRQYGGWYDGNPARLKPAPDAVLARELAELAGGLRVLVARAEARAGEGELRLACHLIELAVQAAPDDVQAHRARAEIYSLRRSHETSLMAKGIYGDAARESEQKQEPAS